MIPIPEFALAGGKKCNKVFHFPGHRPSSKAIARWLVRNGGAHRKNMDLGSNNNIAQSELNAWCRPTYTNQHQPSRVKVIDHIFGACMCLGFSLANTSYYR